MADKKYRLPRPGEAVFDILHAVCYDDFGAAITVGGWLPARRGQLLALCSKERGAAHGYIFRSHPDRHLDRQHLQPGLPDLQKEVTAHKAPQLSGYFF